MERESSGSVLDNVWNLMGFESGKENKLDTDVMNHAWRLARCHSAFRAVIPLFHKTDLPSGPGERKRFYELIRTIMLEAEDTIATMRKYGGNRDEDGESAQLIINTASEISRILVHTSTASESISSQMEKLRLYAGPETIRNIHEFDDLTSDIELRLLHKASDLLDSAAPAFHRSALLHCRQLKKAELENYERICKIMEKHYRDKVEEVLQPEINADTKNH